MALSTNFFSYSPKTRLLYIPALTGCVDVTIDTEGHSKDKGWNGGAYKTAERYESNLTVVDPLTGDIRKSVHLRYPNFSELKRSRSLPPDLPTATYYREQREREQAGS